MCFTCKGQKQRTELSVSELWSQKEKENSRMSEATIETHLQGHIQQGVMMTHTVWKGQQTNAQHLLSHVCAETVKRSLTWRQLWPGWGTWRPCSTLKMLLSTLPWGRSEPWRLRWRTSRPSWPRYEHFYWIWSLAWLLMAGRTHFMAKSKWKHIQKTWRNAYY